MFKRLAFLGLFLASASAEITEAASMREVKKWTDTADENTLIVFDMDYTLVMLEHPAFHSRVYLKHKEWIDELENTLTPDEAEIYWGIFMSHDSLCLIEKETPQFIRSLREQGLKVIILTASPVGTIDWISSIEDWRAEELKKLGIDLSLSFSNASPTHFKDFKEIRGYYPLFKNGILLTNGDTHTKGEVLAAFLDVLDWKPFKVIFIDDKLHYLNSMEKTLSALGINHVGIHYKGKLHVPMTEIPEEEVKAAWENIINRAKQIARGHS